MLGTKISLNPLSHPWAVTHAVTNPFSAIMVLRLVYRKACSHKYSVVVNIKPVETVSDEDINTKRMHQLLD